MIHFIADISWIDNFKEEQLTETYRLSVIVSTSFFLI